MIYMFYEILQNLCTLKGTTITAVLKELKISTSKGTAWKKGSIPNGTILSKLADYFGVTTDYLMGKESFEPLIPYQKKELMDDIAQLTPEQKEIIFRLVAHFTETNKQLIKLKSDCSE